MSYVLADPDLMAAAASDLASIGSNVSAAHMVAAARTTSVIPASADEVSVGIAHLFSQHAQDYQALAGQASAFHEGFVHHLAAGAASYYNIEGIITSLLQDISAGFVTQLSQLAMPLFPLFYAVAVPIGQLFLFVLFWLIVFGFILVALASNPSSIRFFGLLPQ
jgi:hypothetical protein